MASCAPDSALGVPDCAHTREANLLKLGAEHFPFPCSLRELVLDRYAQANDGGANATRMQVQELLAYLKDIEDFNLDPLTSVVRQTELIGDPAVPSREQTAILKWLGKAIELWQQQYPLEDPLAAQVKRLIPLSAALAVTDPRFLQPGAHPLHQLLDTIQARAIGWQSRLDRVGTIFLQQVTAAVDKSCAWFDKQSTDLAGVCDDFAAAAQRDQARAQRMVQRVVETELGKVKTAAAKNEAARMINAGLEKFPIPEDIGEFVKGPWYSSAQLLLLKFGVDSEQWEQMSATTEALLDSLQSLEDAEETRRQYIFEAVTRLPKEMRRWLLSLHHDTEAVNEAMALVEFAHLRNLRRQALDLRQIEPIVANGDHAALDDTGYHNKIRDWGEGQWFSVDSDQGKVRAQLVLKVEHAQQLLFTNMSGIKVLQLSFAEFSKLIEKKKVTPLYGGASFSMSLAGAVGIESEELLEALVNALGQSAPAPEPEPEQHRDAPLNFEPDFAPTSEVELDITLETDEEAELAAFLDSDLDSDLGSDLGSDLNTDPIVDHESAAESEPISDLESESAADAELAEAIAEAEAAAAELDADLQRNLSASTPQEPAAPAQKPRGDYLIDQAEEIKERGGYRPKSEQITSTPTDVPADPEPRQQAEPEPEPEPEPRPEPRPELDLDTAIHNEAAATNREEPAEPAPADTPPAAAEPDANIVTERFINLPMGAWLGFHDGETPLMARLAVHDAEMDFYIFVNRKGVKMRQVSKQELLDLIDAGMVDILEMKSNFRDEVTEVRKRLDQK